MFAAALALPFLAACSTNPATGKSQFDGLMPESQESQVGAGEHEKIAQEFGFYEDAALNAYVRDVAQKVTRDTERANVNYQVYIVDSPIVNAFALPGGYLYVSRGLLALANSEAELAAVLAHETGHVTARHSAERYSHGVMTSIGASILSAAVNAPGLSEAVGLGSNLYMSSYSRTQENEADTLGLRYMTRAGYDATQMSSFLSSLQAESALEGQIAGTQDNLVAGYFSTHPDTAERVNKTYAEAAQYPKGGTVNKDRHLQAINGMIYGDSPRHGFVRGQNFYHPDMDFTFSAPAGYRIINQSDKIVAQGPSGTVVLFDVVKGNGDAASYLAQEWMKGEVQAGVENITVNGMKGATTSFAGTVNGKPADIRLVAIERGDGSFARFQVATPKGVSGAEMNDIKAATYSFRRLTAQERASLKPGVVRVVTASSGDLVASLAARQSLESRREEWFRILNGLAPGQEVVPGQQYKIITAP
ncbi:MAG: M48 family metalloprotease [Alphaproteobacteria bacterium]